MIENVAVGDTVFFVAVSREYKDDELVRRYDVIRSGVVVIRLMPTSRLKASGSIRIMRDVPRSQSSLRSMRRKTGCRKMRRS